MIKVFGVLSFGWGSARVGLFTDAAGIRPLIDLTTERTLSDVRAVPGGFETEVDITLTREESDALVAVARMVEARLTAASPS